MKTKPNDLVTYNVETSYHYDKHGQRQTVQSVDGGLTKREYFAAMAMQGLLANPMVIEAMLVLNKTQEQLARATAISSLQSADALIVELNK